MKKERKASFKKVRQKIKEKKDNLKKEIKEEFFFNVPNTLTLARLVLSFFIVYMLFSGYSRVSVTIVFVIVAITDFFDGYLARKFNQKTKVGARLDQVVDRVFTVVIIISLAFYFSLYHNGKILYLFMLMSREVISLPGILIRIVRDMDAYKVKYIGKLTTFVQSIAIALLILDVSWIIYPVIITSLVGIISGFDYLKDSVM